MAIYHMFLVDRFWRNSNCRNFGFPEKKKKKRSGKFHAFSYLQSFDLLPWEIFDITETKRAKNEMRIHRYESISVEVLQNSEDVPEKLWPL